MHQLRLDQRLQLSYEHTQTSPWWFRSLPVLVVLVVAAVALNGDADASVVAILAIAAVIAALVSIAFGRLTVSVSSADSTVTVAFGTGWPKRKIDLHDVKAVERVRNTWWYGWGLRWIPGGSMYNVWGLDAVQLELSSGKVFRIGTDDPAELLVALNAALRRARGR